MKLLPILFLFFLITSGLYSQTNFFLPVSEKDLPNPVEVVKNIKKISVVRLDETALCKYLGKAPMEFQNNGVKYNTDFYQKKGLRTRSKLKN